MIEGDGRGEAGGRVHGLAASAKRLSRAVARLETLLAVGILLSMVLVASLQALLFNLAENGVDLARPALDSLSWADAFLQKGTLWLAFVGASLATFEDRQISIDVLPRIASPRLARWLKVIACSGAGLAAFALSNAFFQACLVADAVVPFEYERLGPEGRAHACDVAGSDRPTLLCWLRAGLSSIGVSVSSGGGVAQLIAPLALVVMGLRLWGRAIAAGLFPDSGGPPPGDPDAAPSDAPQREAT